MIRSPGIHSARILPFVIILPIVFGVFLAACGGGGESPQGQAPVPPPSGPVSVLSWNPPESFADNVVMDQYRDLDYYELYVRTDANFTDGDQPVALIAAVTDASSSGGTPGSRILEEEFILLFPAWTRSSI